MNFMTNLPPEVDAGAWMLDDPGGYWAFARLLVARHAHYQMYGVRMPTHRMSSKAGLPRGTSEESSRTKCARLNKKHRRDVPPI